MTDQTDSAPKPFARSRRRFLATFLFALGCCLAFLLLFEIPRYGKVFSDPRPLVEWMRSFNSDTSLYFLWLLVLPIFARMRFHVIDEKSDLVVNVESWFLKGRFRPESTDDNWKSVLLITSIVAVIAATNSLWIQSRFGPLAPAYHDEYSYQFQAETLIQGRFANPRFEPAPELFDQMHVLNEAPERFASRYFLGTGIWLAPFVMLGAPYLGYTIAHAIVCMMTACIGRDLSGNGVGLMAGLLAAVIPGLAIFSNLLLAHHPGLVGLTLFLFSYHRFHWSNRVLYGILAGAGLAYAMWCRPMTAFSFGVPYAIHFFIMLFRQSGSVKQRLTKALALGIPIVLGLILLLPVNSATTGDPLLTPYQQYTQLHTPRHVFGWNNRERGEAWIKEQKEAGIELPIIEDYDKWAENLTWPLAIQNEKNRILSTAQWTLGILPTFIGLLLFFCWGQRDRPIWWLIPCVLLCLHAVHFLYWYDGIMHWHYVFEGSILIVLMSARGLAILFYQLRIRQRHWLAIWWAGMFALNFLMAYTTFEPFWRSPVTAAISELSYSRAKQTAIRELAESIPEKPAVLFIAHDPADVHIDYISNRPTLDAEVLRARWLPDKYSVTDLQKLFPERTLWLFDAKTGQTSRLDPTTN